MILEISILTLAIALIYVGIKLHYEALDNRQLIQQAAKEVMQTAINLSNSTNHRIDVVQKELEMVQKAPVLRQYVERFVPVELTPDREKEIMKKMQLQQHEWAKMFGEDMSIFSDTTKKTAPDDLV
jgi:hypothetical protein